MKCVAVVVAAMAALVTGQGPAASVTAPATSSNTCSTLDMKPGVIVNLFEWTWVDVGKECEEFLGPYGYKAVQISPPNENKVIAGRPWKERYEPVSFKLKTRSGNEAEFKEMLKKCNKAKVWVFVEVMADHMATGAGGTCVGTASTPCGTKDKPDPEELIKYMNELIDFGVAGFRFKYANKVKPEELKAIVDKLHNLSPCVGFPCNLKPFIFLDIKAEKGATIFEEFKNLGPVTDYNYGEQLGPCFKGANNLKWLHNFGPAWDLKPSDLSIVFVDNYETEREKDSKNININLYQAYKMSMAFLLAWPHGTPEILSGYRFTDSTIGPPVVSGTENILSPRPIVKHILQKEWAGQHRWRQVYNMVEFYNLVMGTEVKEWWTEEPNQIAFCRGNKGFIAFNLETKIELKKKLKTCLPKGTYCDIISGNIQDNTCTGKQVHVAEDGTAEIFIEKFGNTNHDIDGVLAIHIKSKLQPTLCDELRLILDKYAKDKSAETKPAEAKSAQVKPSNDKPVQNNSNEGEPDPDQYPRLRALQHAVCGTITAKELSLLLL